MEITEIKTDRPYSGILVSPPTEKQKAVIDKVQKDSPAGKAGINEGDLIISINGEETGSLMDFYKICHKHARAGEDFI